MFYVLICVKYAIFNFDKKDYQGMNINKIIRLYLLYRHISLSNDISG
jgi:hypothetical protein